MIICNVCVNWVKDFLRMSATWILIFSRVICVLSTFISFESTTAGVKQKQGLDLLCIRIGWQIVMQTMKLFSALTTKSSSHNYRPPQVKCRSAATVHASSISTSTGWDWLTTPISLITWVVLRRRVFTVFTVYSLQFMWKLFTKCQPLESLTCNPS